MSVDIQARGAHMARLWILIGVTYLVIGATLGAYMGATKAFDLIPVHAHINLVGWASMALAGLIYDRFPLAGGSKLGIAHFWMHNTVLPVTMVALACMLTGHTELDPLVGALSGLLWVTLVVFAVNLYLNMKRA